MGNSSAALSCRTFALLFALTIAVRLPFFFPAVLNWDESTFVLMGQSILDGHLPYVVLWDVKPPLAFAFYSFAIALFGRDLVGIRLAGALCVVAAAVLVYLSAGKLWGSRSGTIAAVLTILGISLLPSGQATMTEHVALVPLLGAAFLLITRGDSIGMLFLSGVLLGTATLVRLNIGFAAIAAGVYIASASIRLPATALRRLGAYAAGGILIVVLTWLPYLLAGQHQLWWRSVIAAPLSYSDAQYSTLQSLMIQLRQALGMAGEGRGYKVVPWFNVMIWLAALAGAATVFRRWPDCSGDDRHGLLILTVLAVAAGFGIVESGRVYEHYMIQLVPFAAMFAAALVSRFPAHALWSSLLIGTVALVLSMDPLVVEYRAMASRALAHENLRYGTAYQIAAYLERANPSGRQVYLLTDHIVYWLVGLYPPIKLATHPSNISKPNLVHVVSGDSVSTEDELQEVFRKSPEFVVMTDNVWYLSDRAKGLLEGIIADRYRLDARIHGRNIYRLKQRS